MKSVCCINFIPTLQHGLSVIAELLVVAAKVTVNVAECWQEASG